MDFVKAGIAAVTTAVVAATVAAPEVVHVPSVSALESMTVLGVEIEEVNKKTVTINGRLHTIVKRRGVETLLTPNKTPANAVIQECYRAWRDKSSYASKAISLVAYPFLSTFMYKRKLVTDRWGLAILRAIEQIGCYDCESFQIADLCFHVAMLLGADNEEQASQGICYHPYSGDPIKKGLINGYIGTWIGERSGHSRQRYWKSNCRVTWTEAERPLLFTNAGLAVANAAHGWRPYSRVSGTGWRLNPTEAKRWYDEERPSDIELAVADAILDNPPPKRDGTARKACRGAMRGKKHTKTAPVISGTYFC